jgi:hypothetical protein
MQMKMSGPLFLVVLATVPVQLGKFFFPDYSFVLGLPVDYRAITIYLSDISISLFLIFFFLENKEKIKTIFSFDYSRILLTFNLYLWISSYFFSVSQKASYFFNIKFLIFSLLMIAAIEVLKSKEMVSKSKSCPSRFGFLGFGPYFCTVYKPGVCRVKNNRRKTPRLLHSFNSP